VFGEIQIAKKQKRGEKETSSQKRVELSIILVNYNTRALLRQCLESILGVTKMSPFEIIVVDNDSKDGSPEMLREHFPQVRLIANRENPGFSRANNQGIRASSGCFVLLLNTDTIVQENALETMIGFLEENPHVGVVGAKLLNEDMTIQAGSKAFPTPLTTFFGKQSLMTRWFPNNLLTRRYLICLFEDHSRPFEVDSVSGAAFMIRRETIEDVGLLDKGYFMYWEDVDWCYRIKKRSWKIYYHPHAPIIHLEGRSSNQRAPGLIIAYHKGVFRLFRKHYFKSYWSPWNLVTLVVLVVRATILIIARNLRR
jgi:GT2 family glycosyltransferase